MKRWINTNIVLDSKGNIISKEGFWYDGPLALVGGSPTVEQTDWAFYNDGTESGSVIIGTKNTNPTLEVDTTYFARFGIEETAGNKWSNWLAQLQYNHNGGGWNNVTASSSVVRAAATSSIADGADTTQRMTSFTYETTNGGFDKVDGLAGDGKTDPTSSGVEALFSFVILSSTVADSDTIVLRVVDSLGVAFDVYNQTDPTITVSEDAPTTSIPVIMNHLRNQGIA